MLHPTDSISSISVSRISLNKTNPRFESVATERLAIEKLCSSENIYPLAADTVNQSSLNPMEIAGLTANTTGKINARTNYTVIEGNRRICALKLLHDPELAPQKLRAKFTKLAETSEPINEVAAVIFQDDAEVWKDKYFKKHPKADQKGDGTLTRPEFQKHQKGQS